MVNALGEFTAEQLRQELAFRAGEVGVPLLGGSNALLGCHPTQVASRVLVPDPPPAQLRLDLGCGKNKKPGFLGVDALALPGVDVVASLAERTQETVSGFKSWPWADGSVEEVHASHFVEHLDAGQRMHFANELHRVLKPGGTASIITPHWNSPRAYGDLTHAWPPVSEWWYLYLSKAWREVNAPHNVDYTCDLQVTTNGYAPNQATCGGKNAEYVTFAMANYRGAVDDLCVNLAKPK